MQNGETTTNGTKIMCKTPPPPIVFLLLLNMGDFSHDFL